MVEFKDYRYKYTRPDTRKSTINYRRLRPPKFRMQGQKRYFHFLAHRRVIEKYLCLRYNLKPQELQILVYAVRNDESFSKAEIMRCNFFSEGKRRFEVHWNNLKDRRLVEKFSGHASKKGVPIQFRLSTEGLIIVNRFYNLMTFQEHIPLQQLTEDGHFITPRAQLPKAKNQNGYKENWGLQLHEFNEVQKKYKEKFDELEAEEIIDMYILAYHELPNEDTPLNKIRTLAYKKLNEIKNEILPYEDDTQ